MRFRFIFQMRMMQARKVDFHLEKRQLVKSSLRSRQRQKRKKKREAFLVDLELEKRSRQLIAAWQRMKI